MAMPLKTLKRWARSPAKDVDAASGSWVNLVRGLATRATTPLLPDDYLSLLNPLWSARELRGEIVAVKPETDDTATVVIRPGWGFSGDYSPGQYVGIGLRVDGKWHWRSYSLTSVPERGDENISITVKATPEGFLSAHLVNGVEPGTIIPLAAPKGQFALPNPPPEYPLFITAAQDNGGEGGTVTFAISDKTIEIDGATSILEAGEKQGIQMPFGCRMGICQTCVLPLEEGHVRDVRSGNEHGAGDRIQTCI